MPEKTKLTIRRRRRWWWWKELDDLLQASFLPRRNLRWTPLVADIVVITAAVLLLVLVPGSGSLHREELLPLGRGQVSLHPLLRPPPGGGDGARIPPATLGRRGAKVFAHRGETSTPTIDERSGRSNFAALWYYRGGSWRTLIIMCDTLDTGPKYSVLTSFFI